MAAVDFFLKLEGIPGESMDDKHKNEIDVLSWNWEEDNSGSSETGGGGGSGRVKMNDFKFTMKASKATPKLMLACATGEHIKSGILTCRKAGGDQQEYLKVTMSDLLVSHFQAGSASAEVEPHDNISLNFAKIEWEYKPQKPDGTLDAPVKAGYNLKEHKKV